MKMCRSVVFTMACMLLASHASAAVIYQEDFSGAGAALNGKAVGPTAANSCPGRFVFIRSHAAKARLKPHLAPGNVDKTMAAPCCVIVCYDTQFYELLPKLFPAP